MPQKENIIGKKYNRLTIVENLPDRKHKTRMVKCLCDCGNYSVVQLSNMQSGHTKSCGCLNIETLKNVKHGMCHSQEYKSYHKMLERCYNPKANNYEDYGGRGIKVCQRWLESFENFFADMGLRPSPKHSLERKNNDGIYEPLNCRWATKKEQANNRRSSTRYQYDGLDMTQAQWSEYLKVPYGKLIFHLNHGVSFPEIVEYIKEKGSKYIRFKPGQYHQRKNKI